MQGGYARATTQNNLAAAYSDRIEGEQTNNLEQAVAAFHLALQVRTCEAFPNDSAYAHTKNGNIQTALLTLELGRARGLSDNLARDRANLNQLQMIRPELFDRYQKLTQELRNLEIQQRNPDTNHPDQLRQVLIQTRQALTETIATIQQVEGYQAFLKPPTFDDITRALTAEQAIVYITTTPAGSLALILTPSTEIHPVWLNDLTQESLEQMVNDWFDAYNQQQRDRQTWFNTIDQTTQTLWDTMMGAIVQKLTELHLNQAVLIPTGLLGFLPLHTAWIPDDSTPIGKRYGLDAIICWSRLWLLLPDTARKDLQEARAELNSAARLWLWSLLFWVWTFLGAWWAIPIGITTAWLTYYGWILDAATTYADLVDAAFDVHRILLYKSLRWTLPATAAAEIAAGKQLTAYLWNGSDSATLRFVQSQDD